MSNFTPNVPFLNKISIMHMPNESAAPPVAWVSVSGTAILSTALSAYTPPRGIWFNTLTSYSLQTFASNIPNALTAVTVTIQVPGYVEGAFNKVLLVTGSEVGAASAAYYVW